MAIGTNNHAPGFLLRKGGGSGPLQQDPRNDVHVQRVQSVCVPEKWAGWGLCGVAAQKKINLSRV